jgi:hypothetical protein
MPAWLFAACAFAFAPLAWAERGRVEFADRCEDGGRDAVVARDDIRQEFHSSRAAMDAARADKPLPDDTGITLVDIRSGQIPLWRKQ